MKKSNLILIFVLLLCKDIFAQEIIEKTPKLLWQKWFNTKITSIATTKDGKRIAQTVGNKLYYLDTKGNMLWEYEYKEKNELSNVVITNNGKYVVCTVQGVIAEEDINEWGPIKLLFFNSKGGLLWSYSIKG